MNNIKDYLGFENSRNKHNAATYERLLKLALGDCSEKRVSVLVGHHLTFEINGDLETENEVPSADCLMFDHDIMKAVFGDDAYAIMRRLATVPCDERDKLLSEYLNKIPVAA